MYQTGNLSYSAVRSGNSRAEFAAEREIGHALQRSASGYSHFT